METGSDAFSIDSHAIELFSPEERSDISARIEAASVRNAVTPPSFPSKTEAARRGLFPLLVNAGALVLLAGGLCLLFASQQSGAAELRASGAALGVAERALIREIRGEADSTLENLSSESRMEILAAREELASLSGEAQKAAIIERQLTGFYKSASRGIEAGRYREAADSVAALKEFLATPSFASIKTIQARQESDAAAINALSALINEALAASANSGNVDGGIPGDAGAQEDLSQDFSETEAALRQQFARELANAEATAAADKALAEAASTEERNTLLAEREKTMAELQKTITDLQEKNAAAQQTIAEQSRQMDSLKSQNVSYAQTIERLQRTISSVNSALENQE